MSLEAGDNVRLEAVVEGRVQGVGFRYFVFETAEALSLTGWVRNTWDGNVEVTAEGPRRALEKLLSALHKGPRSAEVSQVRVAWNNASGEFRSFKVLPTA